MIPMRLPRLGLTLFASLLAASSSAQVSVGPQGSGALTFDTLPSELEWATESFGGDSGGTNIIDAAGLDAQVQLPVSRYAVNRQLGITQTWPPIPNNYARWNTNRCLQSRLGNVEFTVLMATLVNDTGKRLQTLEVSYDFGAGLTAGEHLTGFRGYYSGSGETGSWRVIPEFCTGVTGRVSAVISFGMSWAWFPGYPLYLLWADDNGRLTDGYYSIDNVRVNIAPTLNIRRRDAREVEVSWPAAWWNHFLEVSPSLSQPDWQRASWIPALGNQRTLILPDVADGQRFFRTEGELMIILPAARATPR